ncbi:Cytidylate kinase [Lachnospiraceae bacterium NLAE-zl-G231]|nr:Cytidylate kinase [Lachnospiraceae bacterium NLAE-zl-G231]
MGNLRTITIERQYASGGREIGKRLSEKLGIPFYDGQLLMLAAEKYGLNPEEVKANDEKVNRSLLYSVAAAVENFRGNDRGMLPYRIYQAQAETIRRLSMEGPCIFIGRCAGEILKEKRRSLNVFIYASSMAERRERANQIDNIPMTDADSYIHMKDKQRRDYYKMYAEKEWGDPLNYDLCMNSSALGYDRCVELIERAL